MIQLEACFWLPPTPQDSNCFSSYHQVAAADVPANVGSRLLLAPIKEASPAFPCSSLTTAVAVLLARGAQHLPSSFCGLFHCVCSFSPECQIPCFSPKMAKGLEW